MLFARVTPCPRFGQAVRVPLGQAPPGAQLLDSLVPMWEEERARCGGQLPRRPPSPTRTPQPLCPAVEAVRTEYLVGGWVGWWPAERLVGWTGLC